MSDLRRAAAVVVVVVVVVVWVGAVVAIIWWAFFADRSEPADIVGIVGRSDSTELIVTVRHAACETPRPDVDVDESDTTVLLSARYNDSGSCDDIFTESAVAITLERVLGSRMIESERVNDFPSPVCIVDDVASTQCRQR